MVKAYWEDVPENYELSDTIEIVEHSLPTVHPMTVDGETIDGDRTETDCNGYEIGLEDSWSGDTYVLMLNGDQALDTLDGGPSPLLFGEYNTAGTYAIKAINDSGCEVFMDGSFTIDVDELQTFDLLADNDGRYCVDGDGVDIQLEGSEDGIEYTLFRDGDSLVTETGDGEGIGFGTFSDEGTYYVETISSGGCTYRMNNDISVETVDDPESGNLIDLDGNDGHYCEGSDGVRLSLEISQTENVLYELIDAETGDVLDDSVGVSDGGDIQFMNDGSEYFPEETTYQVRAEITDIGCEDFSNELEVVVDPLPELFDVQIFQEKCGSGGIAVIGIEDSETDVEYRWINNSSDESSWKQGDGNPVDFEVTEPDTYSIEARRIDTDTQCSVVLGDTVVEERDMPATSLDVYDEGGSGCDDGVVIGIADPEIDVTYRLFTYDQAGDRVYQTEELVGPDPVDSVEFSPVVDSEATYYIEATTEYGCSDDLDESVEVDVADAIERYALKPEEGDICNGEAGFVFDLEDSDSGVEYAFVLAGSSETENDTIEILEGDGDALSFSPVNEEGEYFVIGLSEDNEACNNEMLNRSELIVRPLPTSFNMIGSGAYCDEEGADLGVDNSQDGMTYVLQQHTDMGKRIIEEVETSVPGDSIWFEPVTEEDTYSVVAISQYGCTSSMKDSMEVEQLPSPAAPDFTENPLYYCNIDGSRTNISPETVEDGVTYSVFDSDDELVREVVAEGDDIELGPLSEGTYMVRASWENGGCSVDATDSLEIIESIKPIVGNPEYDTNVCYAEEARIGYDISDDEDSWTYALVDGDDNLIMDQEEATERNDSIVWMLDGSDVEGIEDIYIKIGEEDGVCGAEYTNRIDVNFSDPLTRPELDAEDYCPEDNFGVIGIENEYEEDRDITYYLYDSQNIDSDEHLDRIFSNGSDESFFEVTEGEYVVRSRDLDSGCFSEPSTSVSLEEYPEPQLFFLDELITNMDDPEDSLGINQWIYFDSEKVEDGVTYYLDGEGSNVVIDQDSLNIDSAGVYQVTGRYEDTPCDGVTMTGQLTMLEEMLIANDDSLYLPEGVNSDSIDVSANDVFYDIDEGQLDFRLATGDDEDYRHSSLAGDFTIQANGVITFEKAPSFYGEKEIEYIVQNNNFPERKDTGKLYVYVGNKNLDNDKSIFIPNAFSPNDDGVNESFEIVVDDRSEAEESTLEVYNRWGTLVFRSEGKHYNNNWDGTANVSSMVSIGDKLPNGVYFYVYTIRANVDGDIVSKKFNGYVELRR
ncbi:MAG: gliding motility-associated C-terminal domain-containing protein [Marinilabilia sp.]